MNTHYDVILTPDMGSLSTLPALDFSAFISVCKQLQRTNLLLRPRIFLQLQKTRWCSLRACVAFSALLRHLAKRHTGTMEVHMPVLLSENAIRSVDALFAASQDGDSDAKAVLACLRFLRSFETFQVLEEGEILLTPYGLNQLQKIMPYSALANPENETDTKPRRSYVVFDLKSGRFTSREAVKRFSAQNQFWEWFRRLSGGPHRMRLGTGISLLFHDEALRFITTALVENVVEHCGELDDPWSSWSLSATDILVPPIMMTYNGI